MGKRLPEWGPFLWELLGRWIMHMGESKQQQRAWPSNNGQLWAQPGRLILLLTCQSSPQPGKRGTAARQQLLTGQRWPVRLGELDFTTHPPARPRIPPQAEHGYMPGIATWTRMHETCCYPKEDRVRPVLFLMVVLKEKNKLLNIMNIYMYVHYIYLFFIIYLTLLLNERADSRKWGSFLNPCKI